MQNICASNSSSTGYHILVPDCRSNIIAVMSSPRFYNLINTVSGFLYMLMIIEAMFANMHIQEAQLDTLDHIVA
jgi:hypothetical protein